jgi:hypothetical protein
MIAVIGHTTQGDTRRGSRGFPSLLNMISQAEAVR